jgi:AcrR family transcriptional regulator
LVQDQSNALPAASQRVVQRERTRGRLLEAARKAFHLRGVEQVSMEDIAAAAAVSRATIYLHFPGKHILLKALLEEDWQQQIRLFERLSNVQVFEVEQLSKWVLRVAEGMRRARDSFGIHWAALGQNPELIMRHCEHRAELARLLLDWAARDGDRQTPEITIEAELIVAELEHFATAAAIVWSEEQLSVALPMVVSRICKFAIAPITKA